MMNKYIEIIEIERKPKTFVYGVRNIHHGNEIGRILWYPKWRQYVFEPGQATVWSDDCLENVIAFLKKLREDRGIKYAR